MSNYRFFILKISRYFVVFSWIAVVPLLLGCEEDVTDPSPFADVATDSGTDIDFPEPEDEAPFENEICTDTHEILPRDTDCLAGPFPVPADDPPNPDPTSGPRTVLRSQTVFGGSKFVSFASNEVWQWVSSDWKQFRLIAAGIDNTLNGFIAQVMIYPITSPDCMFPRANNYSEGVETNISRLPFDASIEGHAPTAIAVSSSELDIAYAALCDQTCIIARIDLNDEQPTVRPLADSEYDNGFHVQEMWADHQGVHLVGSGYMYFDFKTASWQSVLLSDESQRFNGIHTIVGSEGQIYSASTAEDTVNLLPLSSGVTDDLFDIDETGIVGENGLFLRRDNEIFTAHRVASESIFHVVEVPRIVFGGEEIFYLFGQSGTRYEINKSDSVSTKEQYTQPILSTLALPCGMADRETVFILTEEYIATPELRCLPPVSTP